ncbi:MAG: hypothetical protein GY930_05300 [bacterium]|nr:hypothetical protein [bacterium]
MKFTQRLDYSRLAEALTERDMVAIASIQELLNASNDGGQPFPEALVESNLIPDWDLSRVVCDVFHLPFLPIEQAKPNLELLSLFDRNFLQSTALVPVSRYGNVLTIAMPAIVQADTLALLSAETDLFLLPIVSTVTSNRKWLDENCPVQAFGEDDSWGSLFDEGDHAVQQTLGLESPKSELDTSFDLDDLQEDDLKESLELVDTDLLESADLSFEEDDSDSIEVESSLLDGGIQIADDALDLQFENEDSEDPDSLDLPPMPEFK